MPFDLARTEYARSTHLPRRRTLVLDGAAGTVVTVDDGCVWITLEHDPRDIVLLAGMRFEIDRDGRTVVAAEEDTRLRLTRPLTWRERVAMKLAAYLRQEAPRVLTRLSCRLSRLSAPYY